MADPTYTYTWGFQEAGPLEYVNGGVDDGLVLAVNWQLVCTSSDGYSFGMGNHMLFSKGDSVVPFNDLTKSQVIGWVKAKLGAEEVTRLEVSVKSKVDDKRTPPVKTGVPTSWSNS